VSIDLLQGEQAAVWSFDLLRMRKLIKAFGDSAAEEITSAKFKTGWTGHEEWSQASKNRYLALMKLTYRLAETRQQLGTTRSL
jgi:hypothetical protein